MEILTTVLYIVACVLLFSLAIAIHEFGHFIVALKLGLRVEAFSIGFGPALWKRKYCGVEYRLSAIPLGGYVSIPDVDPEGTKALEGAREEREEKEEKVGGESRSRSRSRSRSGSRSRSRSTEVGKSASRERIPAWKEICVAVAGPGMNLVLAVVLAVALSLVPGARFGELPALVGRVPAEGPAAEAGIRAGDRVVAVGGRPVATWTEMQTEVQITGGKATDFELERGGESVTVSVTPQKDPVTGAYYILAVSVTNSTGAVAWMPSRNPVKQLLWDAGSIFRVLKGLVTPKEAKATAGALGGPVMIAEGIYRSMRRDCWDGVGFLRFLNVNLAVLNLLPIPVLDGGLILFALIALVFRRRVPDKIVGFVTMTFMYLLIAAMGILILKDSWRSWKIHTYKPETGRSSCSSRSGASETNETSNATSQGR